jgi:predicted solute-binding protein
MSGKKKFDKIQERVIEIGTVQSVKFNEESGEFRIFSEKGIKANAETVEVLIRLKKEFNFSENEVLEFLLECGTALVYNLLESPLEKIQ